MANNCNNLQLLQLISFKSVAFDIRTSVNFKHCAKCNDVKCEIFKSKNLSLTQFDKFKSKQLFETLLNDNVNCSKLLLLLRLIYLTCFAASKQPEIFPYFAPFHSKLMILFLYCINCLIP